MSNYELVYAIIKINNDLNIIALSSCSIYK